MLVEGVPAKFPRRTLTLVSRGVTASCVGAYTGGPDCEDATESREQTFIRKRGVHDHLESVR